MQFERYFGLADRPGSGVWCDSHGLLVGETPLLERADSPNGGVKWRPRPLADLNCDFGEAYGLPVEFGAKIGGLAAVARALSDDDLTLAQITTLLLQIPDPPRVDESQPNPQEILDLARKLQASDLLNRDWDPASTRAGRPKAPAELADSSRRSMATRPRMLRTPPRRSFRRKSLFPCPSTFQLSTRSRSRRRSRRRSSSPTLCHAASLRIPIRAGPSV